MVGSWGGKERETEERKEGEGKRDKLKGEKNKPTETKHIHLLKSFLVRSIHEMSVRL